MDRLTIPDKPIEGGMRRTVVGCKAIKEQAMTMYWKLKAYEDTGLEPEEIRERMEPKKPQEVLLAYGTGYECMNCGNELSVSAFDGLYCHWCGQRLEWD